MPNHPHSYEDDARAHALGLLGLVAVLIGFLTTRILPRWHGHAETAPAILGLQLTMVALSAAAWRGVEAPCPRGSDLDRMQGCAEAMCAALRDLLARIARTPRRLARWVGLRGHGPRPSGGVVHRLEGVVVGSSVAGRARDGPSAVLPTP